MEIKYYIIFLMFFLVCASCNSKKETHDNQDSTPLDYSQGSIIKLTNVKFSSYPSDIWNSKYHGIIDYKIDIPDSINRLYSQSKKRDVLTWLEIFESEKILNKRDLLNYISFKNPPKIFISEKSGQIDYGFNPTDEKQKGLLMVIKHKIDFTVNDEKDLRVILDSAKAFIPFNSLDNLESKEVYKVFEQPGLVGINNGSI